MSRYRRAGGVLSPSYMFRGTAARRGPQSKILEQQFR